MKLIDQEMTASEKIIFTIFKSGKIVAQMVKNLPAMQETWVQALS